MLSVSTDIIVLAALVVFAGGVVKGTVGFGYAITSTALLAVLLSPATAVTVMILPMLVTNLTLLRELDREKFRSCLVRFWPYVGAAMAGTVVGMLLLESVPTAVLTVGLGAFTLLYVLVKQPWIQLPGEQAVADYCFTTGTVAKVGLGLVSGVVFGLSNVAVQVVAYLDSLSLDRSTFVGVLAMILVGVSSLRVGLAWQFGLYGSGDLLLYSLLASAPGIVGVAVGKRIRTWAPESYQQAGVLVLLTSIGVRLLSKGL